MPFILQVVIKHEDILLQLRHKWFVESVDQYITGYWTMGDDTFDLRELKTEEGGQYVGEGDIYLDTTSEKIIIRIGGDESFYEIEKMQGVFLSLTCYFTTNFNNNNLTRQTLKLMTLHLNRK